MAKTNIVFDAEVFEPVMSGASFMLGLHRDEKGYFIETTRGVFRSNTDWGSALEYGTLYALILDEESMTFSFDKERAWDYLIW